MNYQQFIENQRINRLKNNIFAIALDSIREANKGNPFIGKSEAFKFWNEVR